MTTHDPATCGHEDCPTCRERFKPEPPGTTATDIPEGASHIRKRATKEVRYAWRREVEAELGLTDQASLALLDDIDSLEAELAATSNAADGFRKQWDDQLEYVVKLEREGKAKDEEIKRLTRDLAIAKSDLAEVEEENESYRYNRAFDQQQASTFKAANAATAVERDEARAQLAGISWKSLWRLESTKGGHWSCILAVVEVLELHFHPKTGWSFDIDTAQQLAGERQADLSARRKASAAAARGRKPRVKCAVESCDRLDFAQDLCPKHYRRLLSNGSPHLFRRKGHGNRPLLDERTGKPVEGGAG